MTSIYQVIFSCSFELLQPDINYIKTQDRTCNETNLWSTLLQPHYPYMASYCCRIDHQNAQQLFNVINWFSGSILKRLDRHACKPLNAWKNMVFRFLIHKFCAVGLWNIFRSDHSHSGRGIANLSYSARIFPSNCHDSDNTDCLNSTTELSSLFQ